MEIGATSSPCATGGVAVVGDFFDRGGGVCHGFHLLCICGSNRCDVVSG